MRAILSASVVLGLLISVGLPGPIAAEDDEAPASLDFGVYTSDKPSTMFAKFKPILAQLESSMSARLDRKVRIKLRIFNTYEGATDALVRGDIDFARFGPASYVLAKARDENIRVLAKELNEGKDRFEGVIVVRKDDAAQSLADLKGRRFAFGDSQSTIGRFLSQALLADAGLRWSDLSKAEYLERHDRVATAVLQGDFDAGAVKIETFAQYEKQGLRSLVRFWNVTKPWVARSGLSEEIYTSLGDALIAVKDAGVLSKISSGVTGFAKAQDPDYELVRRGMKRADEFIAAPGSPATTADPEAPVTPEAAKVPAAPTYRATSAEPAPPVRAVVTSGAVREK